MHTYVNTCEQACTYYTHIHVKGEKDEKLMATQKEQMETQADTGEQVGSLVFSRKRLTTVGSTTAS